MTVTVAVPWRGGCFHREAALAWVLEQYACCHPDWQVVIGEAPPGPWVKALAVAAALEQVTGDLLILADADVWTDGLARAVEAVENGAPWALPHGNVHRLDQPSTAAVLAGGPLGGRCVQAPYRGHMGGVLVLRRDAYEGCPLDPRFEGWGREDDSWGIAMKALHGQPWRGRPILWHLWHPPQERPSRTRANPASEALFRRYQMAARKPERIRALLEEVTTWPRSPSVCN